jgi:acyl-CoA synthetase (AMP-forming)/AMP-acid ligase II
VPHPDKARDHDGGAGSPPPLRWRSIGELLSVAANLHPDDEYLRFPEYGCSLTFGDAQQLTEDSVRMLTARGVGRGDRVAIVFPNAPAWPISFLATLRIGAVSVPINPQFRTADMAHVLRDSGAKLVLTSAESQEVVVSAIQAAGVEADVVVLDAVPVAVVGGVRRSATDVDDATQVENDWLASFQYTSGTTGFPKACMLTHEFWLRLAGSVVDAVEVGENDVAIMAQPWSYMDQQWMSVVCLMTGRPLVVLPRFSASGFWDSVRRENATFTYVLGTMPRLLAKQPQKEDDRNHSMRLVLCSGIPKESHADLELRWGVPWRETYGSSESGCDLIALPSDTDTVGTGAMGRPSLGKSVSILDETGQPVPDGEVGEIVVSGRGMMLGYWNAPDATTRVLDATSRTYRTGDRGFRDASGYIHHAGRLKEMIRRGGENISAAEIEAALALHPSVLNVAVVGIPDDTFGERVKAFIVSRPSELEAEELGRELSEYAASQLARFKLPEYYEFLEEFPMTPSQRIQKKKLLSSDRDQRVDVFDVRADRWVTSPDRHKTQMGIHE